MRAGWMRGSTDPRRRCRIPPEGRRRSKTARPPPAAANGTAGSSAAGASTYSFCATKVTSNNRAMRAVRGGCTCVSIAYQAVRQGKSPMSAGKARAPDSRKMAASASGASAVHHVHGGEDTGSRRVNSGAADGATTVSRWPVAPQRPDVIGAGGPGDIGDERQNPHALSFIGSLKAQRRTPSPDSRRSFGAAIPPPTERERRPRPDARADSPGRSRKRTNPKRPRRCLRGSSSSPRRSPFRCASRSASRACPERPAARRLPRLS